MTYTVSDFVVDSLVNQNIHQFYMLPGGGCMYLVDALVRRENINVTTLLHEQSVGVAAEAHAQYTNGLAVALVTTGPGGTNAITPCAAAWTDSTPVIFISGQVKSSDSRTTTGVRQFGFQEVPITSIVSSITKVSITLTNVTNLPSILSELIELSQSGRPGPVWLDIPLDLQNMEVNYSPLPLIEKRKEPHSVQKEVIERIISSWNNAKRPILLVGNGVRLSKADANLRELISLTRTPTLLTWKALDLLDDSDKLNAGRPGAIAQRWSNFAQQTSDFILCIGARLDLGQVAYRMDTFAPRAEKFIVDIDPSELKKFEGIEAVRICSDAGSFIEQLLTEARKSQILPDTDNWIKRIQEWKHTYPLVQEKHLNPTSGVNLYVFINELSNLLSEDDVIVPGSSGACSEITMQAFRVKLGQRILNSEALGPMGFGVPAAIGVCIANQRKRIISIDGDGGFLMNVQELATIEYMQLPIKIFVLNNDGYGSIKSSQDGYFNGRRIGTDRTNGLGLPVLEKITGGFSLDYLKIASNSDVITGITNVLSNDRPTIIEIIVDPNQITEPRTTTQILANGRFETAPMEYLKPAIDEEELLNALRF
jgi:acetolactate synthase-1/2/3 large subunit